MQIIRYTPHGRPHHPSAGVFFFPVPAILRILERDIGAFHHLKTTTPAIWKLVDASAAHSEEIYIDYDLIGLDDRMAAVLIERGAFSAYCPHCESFYTRSRITTESWQYYYNPEAFGGGRRYLCEMGHELLNVQDWRG